jgi:tetratricopeptide (TPR) repeat protein
MSPAPSADYGTDDARAFAHFVAGLFAERTGRLDAAAELYTTAIRLDSDYHKALNNRGFLMQGEGAALYVKRTDDARARQLLEDASGLFARAKVLKGVAEYHYNYATTLSYLGRLELRAGRRPEAHLRQIQSIAAYNEALLAVYKEVPSVDEPAQRRWWRRRPSADQERYRSERQGFKRSVQLAMAISWVLRRELEGKPVPAPEEQAALKDVFAAFTAKSREPSHPRLEYNLACYHAVTKDWKQARSLFLTLRAVTPDLARVVLADPDLADSPEIIALFTSTPAAAPAVQRPFATDADDDSDRD